MLNRFCAERNAGPRSTALPHDHFQSPASRKSLQESKPVAPRSSIRPAIFACVEGKAIEDVMDFGPAKSAFLTDPEVNLIAFNESTG